MKPLVSILIPAFNAEHQLADTLCSALAQTWARKEIIVVDDGSIDQTLRVARLFGQRGVQVFTQEHRGAAAARNHAFSRCAGDYIQWLDADDLLAPDKIARQLELAGNWPNSKVLLSAEWAKFLHRPYRAQFRPSSLWRDLLPAEWLMRKMEHNVFMQTATWLVSRELTEAAGPWDSRLLSDDDGEYFCRVLRASDGVQFAWGSQMYYRQLRSKSLGYIGDDDTKREAMWLSMKLHVEYLLSMENSVRARKACVTYLQNCLPFFYPDRRDLVSIIENLALGLGGRLDVPRLPKKYVWIDRLFGARIAWQMQRELSGFRWQLQTAWDKLLADLSTAKENLSPAPTGNKGIGLEAASDRILMRSAQ